MSTIPVQPINPIDYFNTKLNNRTYISKSITLTDFMGNEEPRKIRILSKVFDNEEPYKFAMVNKDLVLRVTPKERQEVKIVFYEDTRGIKNITIQRFSKNTGKPHPIGFTFSGKEIETIFNLFTFIRYVDLADGEKFRLDDNVMDEYRLSVEEKRKLLSEDPDLVKEIVEQNITTFDIKAIAYRRNQLDIFNKLLTDNNYFDSLKNEWGCRCDEAVWQRFFEQNSWIFGYGLNFIISSQLDDKKLEQYSTGFSFNEAGKRTDALMKTRGIISSLCFAEIKTHRTPLLKSKEYRSECWQISDELSGSVAQIQKTVQKAIKSIQTKTQLTDNEGNLTNETVFLYQPKSFIVIGNLDQFLAEYGVNEQKYSSFELFRRNLTNPEIITYDELYERAKFIAKFPAEGNNQEDTEEIPF